VSPLDRRARLLVVTAAAAAIGAAYVFAPAALWARAALAALVTALAAVAGWRWTQTLGAGRRYTQLLETEIASQTQSLMGSLAAAARAEWNLRQVMDAVPDAIVVADREGRILDANAPARALAAPRAAADGATVFDALAPEAVPMARERLAAAFRGELQRFEAPLRRGDRARGVAAVVCAPVREAGGIPRVLVVARDVTDAKHAAAQLQQAEKLAALSQLVSGVAHEINNPTAIISGVAQTLLLDDLRAEHREMLQVIHDEATRIGRITANLLAFARAGGTQRAFVDLNDIVRRTFALQAYHLTTLNIAVLLELDAAGPQVWANAVEIQQVVLNLLLNAEQALVTVPPPRTITIRTSADERHALLEVADSGPGIPPEIRHRIFDPFFTTKPQGVGTGLGLSICYGIAEEHGGRIWVESEPGRGARFCVLLPRDPRAAARPAPAPPTPPTPAAPAAGPLNVLIVDDEPALRGAVVRFLDRRGLHAQGAADGAEALELLRHHPFDAIISDVRMPGMSGLEFLERLRHDHPELASRVIFSTGDAYAPEVAELLQNTTVPTITKPFDFAALERTIREVAARGHADRSLDGV
jgi:two-component system NtrC family sensor kinase